MVKLHKIQNLRKRSLPYSQEPDTPMDDNTISNYKHIKTSGVRLKKPKPGRVLFGIFKALKSLIFGEDND